LGLTESTLPDELARQAAELLQELIGPGHPAVAKTLHNLALICDGEGRPEVARCLWAQARSVFDDPVTDITDHESNRYSCGLPTARGPMDST
jgi:hypothetical protein